jgi:hypothetical protein
MDDAECLNQPLQKFFPTKVREHEAGKEVCNGNKDDGIKPCPVRLQCLAWIMSIEKGQHKRYGVVGGLEPQERKELQRKLDRLKELGA